MKKLLIVDDDEGNVMLLSTILTESGYETIAAYNGVEGFERAKAEKPALIILDVMMPKRSGFVLFGQLKRDEELKNIPVIMLTAVADTIQMAENDDTNDAFSEIKDAIMPKLKEKVDGFRKGGDAKPEYFLDKPVEPETLLNIIKELIGLGNGA
ncbi:MAG: response regulator [bacterium]